MDVSTTAHQPAKAFDLRTAMPLTAAWIDERRADWGRAYVDEILKRAKRGERDCFYAIEAGHIWGQPFTWKPEVCTAMSMAVLSGARFLAAMRDPISHGCSIAVAEPAATDKA